MCDYCSCRYCSIEKLIEEFENIELLDESETKIYYNPAYTPPKAYLNPLFKGNPNYWKKYM